MFTETDFYTLSGPTKLYHCWTDKVTKHDSSSFYNWEQDNLPILDLEERTFYLWEQLGYQTSSMLPAMLVVSADAPDSAIACNKNIFRSVSSAIQAVPQNITFPIIIEIANFGDIGSLELSNYKFGPRGSLEIINRNFSQSTATYRGSTEFAQPIPISVSAQKDSTLGGNLKYGYVSSLESVGYTFALDFITDSPAKNFQLAKCVSISSLVFSSITDSRLSGDGGKLNGFVSFPKNFNNTEVSRQSFKPKLQNSTLVIAGHNTQNPYFYGQPKKLQFKAYEYSPLANEEIETYDYSAIDAIYTQSYVVNSNNLTLNESIGELNPNSLFYGNKTNKIIINNCDGPIFIRNFFLDGSGFINIGNNKYGVEINNSPKIFLENIVSTRFSVAGFIFNNSNVTLLRGCVGVRNYGYSSVTGKRLSTPTRERRYLNYVTDSDINNGNLNSAGLIANNSTVTFSSTHSDAFTQKCNEFIEKQLSFSFFINNQGVVGTSYADNFFFNSQISDLFEFSRNLNGIILNNSTLTGGYSFSGQGNDPYTQQMNLCTNNNNNDGIYLQNSILNFNGSIQSTDNCVGIRSDLSKLALDKFVICLNQHAGIKLQNSNLVYNKSKHDFPEIPYLFSGNGQHLILDQSTIHPVITSSMDSYSPVFKFTHQFGDLTLPHSQGYTHGPDLSPGILINNGSTANLFHAQIDRGILNSYNEALSKGSEILVKNNSKLVLKGSQKAATKIIGPANYRNARRLAAVCAENNSSVTIEGPTVIAQFGVDLLAENNSSIIIRPHTNEELNALDISSFTLLNPANHTMVELHSTRSCIIVKDNSNLIVRDLGSYKNNWLKNDNTPGAQRITTWGVNYPVDTNLLQTYFSGGYLQFYPNPDDPTYYSTGTNGIDYLNKKNVNFDMARVAFETPNTGRPYFIASESTPKADYVNYTYGGTCVRALGGSNIDLLNVNFPAGWWNASGIIYDASTVGDNLCNLLFIWNIADSSKIKASLLSISGTYPSVAPYFGPSGDWGTSGWTNKPNPDTLGLSVLDYFGKSTRNPYGKPSQQNYGPFRLYFSVNSAVNALTEGAGGSSRTAQIYSQGYQSASSLSSAYMSSPSEYSGLSSLNVSLMNNINSIPTISGYYNGYSMMENTSICAFFDESAAETFANAKHCSVGKSGLAKLVSISLPYKIGVGDCAEENQKSSGFGYRVSNNFDLRRLN